MSKVEKRVKAKKQTLRIITFGFFCIFIIVGLLTTITKFWINIYEKNKEKKYLEEKILALKEKEEELSVDVERLQDPEYIARYLREKYFYSKPNEYIIRIPEKSEK